MKRISQFVAFVVVGLAGLTGTAFAHAEFDPATAVAGSGTNLNISVPNEHATANTIKVELLNPVECAKCVIKPLAPTGWVAQYANSTITWTGGKITGTDRVAFTFTVDALPADGTLVFKALQTYDNTEVVRWVEPPLADGSEPAHPAPELTLTAGNTSVTTTRDSRAHHAHRTSLHICGFFVGQSEDLGIKERLCSIIAHAAPERGQFGGAGSVGYSATSLRELACEISR